jgi:hypothetical protein
MRRPASQPGSCTRLILIAMALIALTGCSPSGFAQTPFQREASDVASAFSAAATTLEQLHTGKLDERYAKASMVVYRQLATGADTSLPAAGGAPDMATFQPVLGLVNEAEDVMQSPCLADACDWQRQVDTLNAARDALLEASQ